LSYGNLMGKTISINAALGNRNGRDINSKGRPGGKSKTGMPNLKNPPLLFGKRGGPINPSFYPIYVARMTSKANIAYGRTFVFSISLTGQPAESM